MRIVSGRRFFSTQIMWQSWRQEKKKKRTYIEGLHESDSFSPFFLLIQILFHFTFNVWKKVWFLILLIPYVFAPLNFNFAYNFKDLQFVVTHATRVHEWIFRIQINYTGIFLSFFCISFALVLVFLLLINVRYVIWV